MIIKNQVFNEDYLDEASNVANNLQLWLKETGDVDENGKKLYIVTDFPQNEELLLRNKILDFKRTLSKYKEDVEQVELFGMERADYEEKKKACAEIIVQLRELEKKV